MPFSAWEDCARFMWCSVQHLCFIWTPAAACYLISITPHLKYNTEPRCFFTLHYHLQHRLTLSNPLIQGNTRSWKWFRAVNHGHTELWHVTESSSNTIAYEILGFSSCWRAWQRQHWQLGMMKALVILSDCQQACTHSTGLSPLPVIYPTSLQQREDTSVFIPMTLGLVPKRDGKLIKPLLSLGQDARAFLRGGQKKISESFQSHASTWEDCNNLICSPSVW